VLTVSVLHTNNNNNNIIIIIIIADPSGCAV
jgi:hypothetical protein